MVSLMALWLPIVLAAVLVFVVSSVIHMFLPWHAGDWQPLPREDEIRDALRPIAIPPGDYYTPYASGSEEMRSEAWRKKCEEGPVFFMTVLPDGVPRMGAQLLQWFVYCAVIGLFAGYVTGIGLGYGAGYMDVFRVSGAVAFIGYSMSIPQGSIWYRRSWGYTIRSMIDGLVYGVVTGGVFGWLWPS